MSSVCGTMKTGQLQISGDSSYVQHSFSARKIVENYECRTSTERAQHEAKRHIQCATLNYTLIIYIKLHLNYLYEKAK